MTSQNRFYITTTIPYVNSRPHLGHAMEFAQTDSFARFRRALGDDTYVLTGSDENSLKNVRAAEEEGITTRELVDRNSARFSDLGKQLDFQFDQFIRTAVDPRHAEGCRKIWRAVEENGDIYTRQYTGLYCVRCELFYDESELTDGNCPEHGIPPELVEEENYFFRLSKYADELTRLISSDRLQVIPVSRKNEVLRFIERGLEDFSISRTQERAKNWGIPVPDDPSQVMYVWFDALTNYITALDYATEGNLYQRYWVDNPNRMHALGKGVIRFHAIYWPAMLLSAGVPLPRKLFVHGYINMAGTKMSKSIGNVIDPTELIEAYGPMALRYYLLRGISGTGDTNFSTEYFEARYSADLGNNLGNLLNRTLTMIERYRDGQVPAPGTNEVLVEHVRALVARTPDAVIQAMDQYDPQLALDAIWEIVAAANKFAEESAPWTQDKLAKSGDEEAGERLDTALYTLAEACRIVAVLLEPFLPTTAGQMQTQLGLPKTVGQEWGGRLSWGSVPVGTRVRRGEPLFPRLERPVPAS